LPINGNRDRGQRHRARQFHAQSRGRDGSHPEQSDEPYDTVSGDRSDRVGEPLMASA
jgi:hypothetical protein